jgi:hypothetical protein
MRSQAIGAARQCLVVLAMMLFIGPAAMAQTKFGGNAQKRCQALQQWVGVQDTTVDLARIFRDEHFVPVFGRSYDSMKDKHLRGVYRTLYGCALPRNVSDALYTAFAPISYRTLDKNGAKNRYITFRQLVDSARGQGPQPKGPYLLHKAGLRIHSQPDLDIHFRAGEWQQANEKRCGADGDATRRVAVHKVDDDFPITEEYLRRVLYSGLIDELMSKSCPASTATNVSHYFSEHPINRDAQELSEEAAVNTSLQREVLSSWSRPSKPGDVSFRGLLKDIRGYAYTDVTRYVRNGQKADWQLQLAEEKLREAEAARLAREARIVARQAWFAREKPASNWPLGDDALFDIYMLGGVSTVPAPHFRERPENDRDGRGSRIVENRFTVLAYVETASKRCGAKTPNGATVFELSSQRGDGPISTAQVTVDRSLADTYETTKRLMGISYRILDLYEVKQTSARMEPLFDQWVCGGPEWARFIRGLDVISINR